MMISRDFEMVLDAVRNCLRQMGCHSAVSGVSVSVFDRNGRAATLQFNEDERCPGNFSFQCSLHWQGSIAKRS